MKKKRPKIGLALGGGMAKGLAHIGVLKVLKENNIPIDYVSGTSIGAIIGGFYCSGLSPKEIEDFALNTQWRRLFNFTIPKNYFVRKYAMRGLIRKMVKDKDFNEMKPRLFISGTRLKDGQKIVFNKGNVSKAIMASMSLSGILKPEIVDGVEIIDGGMVDPLPVESLKGKCDKIIAVDLYVNYKEQLMKVSHVKDKSLLTERLKKDFVIKQIEGVKSFFKKRKFKKIPSIIKTIFLKILDYMFTPAAVLDIMAGQTPPEITETILQSYTIVMNRLSDLTLKCNKVDILIRPESKYLGWFEFDKAESYIEEGEKAARAQLSAIKRLVN